MRVKFYQLVIEKSVFDREFVKFNRGYDLINFVMDRQEEGLKESYGITYAEVK